MKQIKKMDYMKKKSLFGYFFIFPLILGALFVFLPNLIQTLRFSINEVLVNTNGYDLKYEGFKYYVYAFKEDPKFVRLLLSDMRAMLIHVPVITIYSLFVSTLLNQNFKGRTLARIIFFIPVIFATGIITIVDSAAVSYLDSSATLETGSSLDLSGFSEISGLLSSLNFSPFLIDIVTSAVSDIQYIVNRSGIQIVIFLAGLQEISPALYEAAQIEGCGKWELFWKITFPMISPQIAVNIIYTIADICSRDGYLLSYSLKLAFGSNQYALSTAMNIIFLVCLTAFVGIILWALMRIIPRQS